MEFTTGQWAQLITALALGVSLFVAAYLAPPRVSIGLLLLLIPFQVIGSRFGTLNMGLIYLVGLAHLLRGRIRALPLIGFFVLILFVYLLSMSQTLQQTYIDHGLYLFGLGANVALFYVVYNYVRVNPDIEWPIRMLLWVNVLVLVFIALQLATGTDRFAFMGVREFAASDLQLERQRLVGPFGAPGTNAEYFVIQILLLSYYALHAPTRARLYFIVAVILADFGALLMTGSRGSFLALVGGSVLFLWFFRHQLGVGRAFRIAAGGFVLAAVVTAIVLNFSQFNTLFDRLAATELRGGLPDTRALAFTLAWERIPEKAMLGHGPRLRLVNEFDRRIRGHEPLHYPHNLYLFLAMTVGIVGLAAYLLMFLGLYLYWSRARRYPRGSPFLDGVPTLAILLLIVFLVDQLKIEFLRTRLSDHQQYMFALWAILLGLSARRRISKPATEPDSEPDLAPAGLSAPT